MPFRNSIITPLPNRIRLFCPHERLRSEHFFSMAPCAYSTTPVCDAYGLQFLAVLFVLFAYPRLPRGVTPVSDVVRGSFCVR